MKFPVSKDIAKILKIAKEAAIQFSSEVIGTEHILYGLYKYDKGKIYKFLSASGVSSDELEELFKEDKKVSFVGEPEITSRVRQTFFDAFNLAKQGGVGLITAEYLLLAMLLDGDSRASRYIAAVSGTPPLKAYKEFFEEKVDNPEKAEGALNGLDPLEQLYKLLDNHDQRFNTKNAPFNEKKAANSKKECTSKLPAQLLEMGIDITDRVKRKKVDPIIGREEEIERIIEILCRKTKNNPVLIGEPGVGKTAVVEGLAVAMASGEVPEILKGKILFSLDIGSLVAGTQYRGALEKKIKDAIDLIMQNGNIIVFIDEFHTLAQAGSSSSEISPADTLKPYLARGEMQTIGATTTDEYRKFVEKDKALERRFQPIMINPPSIEEAIKILEGLRESYEAFHKVSLSNEAIAAAVKLSDRYIMDRFLPDKAIDLIDEAMSRAKISRSVLPKEIKEKEEKLKELEKEMADHQKKEDYKNCERIKKEKDRLKKQIEGLKLEQSKQEERADLIIKANDIASVVAKWTKIPVTRLTETEQQRLLRLEEILAKRVIGQEHAVEAVAKSIRRNRAGLGDRNRPIGTFLFLGSTGVGKTELTKALAEALFDDESAVIRVDMSEYMEQHSVSKLIGSPPGYVGFDDGGQLTEQARRKPYSVVLFDEIEKAHPDVINTLLQIMDDGRLTDSRGRVVSFKNTIIILTSNIGAEIAAKKARGLGFSESVNDKEAEDEKLERVLLEALKKSFRPEFLNRIDVVSVFKKLTKQQIGKIADILLNKVARSLSETDIVLQVTDRAKDFLIEKGYDPEYGARPLRRVIQAYIEDNIADALLSKKIKKKSTVIIDYENNEIVIK